MIGITCYPTDINREGFFFMGNLLFHFATAFSTGLAAIYLYLEDLPRATFFLILTGIIVLHDAIVKRKAEPTVFSSCTFINHQDPLPGLREPDVPEQQHDDQKD